MTISTVGRGNQTCARWLRWDKGAGAVRRLDVRVSVGGLSLRSLRAPAEPTSVLNLGRHLVAGPPNYQVRLFTTLKTGILQAGSRKVDYIGMSGTQPL